MDVDDTCLLKSKEKKTSLAIVHLSDRGDRTFSFYRDGSISADICIYPEELVGIPWHEIETFHFGSVSLSEEPARGTTLWAVQKAKEAGVIITYDPNIRLSFWKKTMAAKQLILEVLALADIVKLSGEELTFLTDNDDWQSAAQNLAKE